MVGFKKPTALDGIFFDEWVPSPSSPWGITGGGSLEAVAPKITLSQTTELEFLPGDMSGAEVSVRPEALKGLLTPNLDKLEEIESGVSERYVGDHERKYEGRQPLLKYVEGRAARKMGKRTEPGSLAAYCKASGMSIGKNNKTIEILDGKGETLRERVPDFFAEGRVVGDIKNVKTLSLDAQMRDNVRISKGDNVKLRGSSVVLGATNRFDLAIRVPGEDGKMGTHVSDPLKAAVAGSGGTIYEVIE
jgi:hypothetical protein